MNEPSTLLADHEAGGAWRDRSEALIQSVPDAVVAIDPRGAIDFLNPGAERLFGYGPDDALGRSFAALLAERHQDEYATHMREHARGETIPVIGLTREVVGRRADGSTFAMELTLTDLRPMEQRMLVAVARDIRERKRDEASLLRLAGHDEATGLPNRRSFEQELTRHIEYAARYGHGGSAVLLDVDNFEHVNETLGRAAGDELIRLLAELIGKRLRRTDVLARLGGDQLGILLHGAGRAAALGVARDLLALIREHEFVVSEASVEVTASAGLAPIEERPITGSELLAETEVAVREAKQAGRDRVVDYTAEGYEEAETDQIWSERVRQATESGLFALVCQPIADLASGRITQYELLLRVRGEEGELLPPGVFLSTAERFGLTGAVDRWVTQQAVRLIAARREEGNHPTLEVNLSAKTLTDPNFPAQLQEDLATTGVDPSQLVFEVSEAAAVADVENAKQMAQKLTALGCRFALDDFGANLASLYHLKRLPISFLKIDGEFVKALTSTPADQLIVKALVDVCKGLDIKTIAEFVEDEPTLAILRETGVDLAQGYFIGHPQPIADLGAEPQPDS